MSAFTVIASFAGSSKLETNAWADLCRLSHNTPSSVDFANVLKNGETEFKERTGESSLPSRYRSAKSVIIRARDKGVEYVSEGGEALGKTAVEKALRGAPVKKSPIEQVDAALSQIKKALTMCSNMSEVVALRVYIDTNLKTIIGE